MDNGKYSLSLYTDDIAQITDIAIAIKKLSVCFPKMSVDFWNVLSEYIASNKFTHKRLKDAVDHIITTFQYSELKIADIISYDKTKDLLTYNQVLEKWMSGVAYDKFEHTEINGKNFWFYKND
ncbi:MAG: hypothetical protein LBV74_01195 [Tannerella sp.]|jgi:hypothetical protein|nr:hypothetical protein [Tannerella sp.]